MAQRLTYVTGMVVSGRGYAASTALELSLKLKEACYVTAIGLSYADLLHGPIAVVDADTPALLVPPARARCSPDDGARTTCTEVGAHVYGIGGDDAFAAACRSSLPGTTLPEHLAPLAMIVPGQLLVEALARAKGLDPDRRAGCARSPRRTPGPDRSGMRCAC